MIDKSFYTFLVENAQNPLTCFTPAIDTSFYLWLQEQVDCNPASGSGDSGSGSGPSGSGSGGSGSGSGSGPPPIPYSISFDGSVSYITVPDHADLRLLGDFTISCWAKKTGGPYYTFEICKQTTTFGQQNGWLTYNASGATVWDLTFGTATNPNGFIRYTDSFLNSIANDWHHYALTGTVISAGTNTAIRWYIDGVLKNGPLNMGARILTGTDPLDIGRRDNANQTYGIFMMDDFRLFNRALSDLDIEDLASPVGCLEPPCPPIYAPPYDPILWFKFDEGSGTTITDSSGNGHHGTIVGSGVTWSTDQPL